MESNIIAEHSGGFSPTTWRAQRHPAFMRNLQKAIARRVHVGKDIDEEELVGGTPPGFVLTTIGNLNVLFIAGSSLADEPMWDQIFTTVRPLSSPFTYWRVRGHFFRVVREIITTNGLGRDKLRNWLTNVFDRLCPIASQGIVVAGEKAEDVRLLNNSVRGVAQGIHVGTSRREERSARRSAGRVLIAGNKIDVVLNTTTVQPRHGIFVGNVGSLSIKDNRITATKVGISVNRPIDGIRVFGALGRMVLITQNDLTGFTTGISVTALNNADGAGSLWRVTENMAADAQTTVDKSAAASVEVSLNKP